MDDSLKNLSNSLNIPVKSILAIYKLYWLYIKKHIEELPLLEINNKEDFDKLRVSFNLPKFGKLYCTYENIERVKKKYNENKYKKDKTNV